MTRKKMWFLTKHTKLFCCGAFGNKSKDEIALLTTE